LSVSQTYKAALSVRWRLRNATKARHEAVHVHPLFSRLLAADIKAYELEAINLAHLRALEQVESARYAQRIWPELSLHHRIMALRSDLSHVPEGLPAVSNMHPCQVLGGLYVVFGSAFGAHMIVKSLKRALPDSRMTYYEIKDPSIWHMLCARLERLETPHIAYAIDGANATFDALLSTPAWIPPSPTDLQNLHTPTRHLEH